MRVMEVAHLHFITETIQAASLYFPELFAASSAMKHVTVIPLQRYDTHGVV